MLRNNIFLCIQGMGVTISTENIFIVKLAKAQLRIRCIYIYIIRFTKNQAMRNNKMLLFYRV